MSKHLKITTNHLKNITDVEEEFSEYDEQEISGIESNMATDKELFTNELKSESDSEEESIINKRPGQKRKRVLLTSESEAELEDQGIETAADGTVWEEINGSPNFFTSISLAKKLLAKNTTIVGTIRGNEKELPKLAKQRKDKMARFSSKLYKSNYITLTVYKSKPKKKVLVLSTKHNSIEIEKNNKRIPETIRFYNNTKFGVDVADQMARKYSVKSKSCRWPLQVFFNILDLAGINAWILYKETTGENISRQEFLFQLASELSDAYIQSKENKILPIPSTSSDISLRKTCQIKFCKGYKTTKICSKCEKYVCGKCTFETKIICKQCEKAE